MSNSRLRFPLLAAAILTLLAAMWGGLIRIGWHWPALSAAAVLSHGPLMVSGFLGTLIGVERAVALRRRWTYIAPLLSGLGALFILVDLGPLSSSGPWLIFFGSLGLSLVFLEIIRQHPASYTYMMGTGAACWLIGNSLWVSGRSIHEIVLWWAAFLILTIAGERLELGRFSHLTQQTEALFLLIAGLLIAGLIVLLFFPDPGVRLVSAAVLGLAAWLYRFDIARRTIRKPGLPRFIAICLLSGYVWLAAAGVIGMVYGAVAAGLHYDALLHAIFLGFVFAMIFGHAPIIFPAVLGVPVTFRRQAYLYLGLFHLSLITRITGDLAGFYPARKWGGLFNGLAILFFLGYTAYTILKAHRTPGESKPEGGLSEQSGNLRRLDSSGIASQIGERR